MPTDITTGIDQEVLRQLCPPYKVILLNDDYTPMDDVIVALIKSVPSLDVKQALDIMMTAHTQGSAVVIVAPKEAAEHYQERILSFKIGCTIEPDC